MGMVPPASVMARDKSKYNTCLPVKSLLSAGTKTMFCSGSGGMAEQFVPLQVVTKVAAGVPSVPVVEILTPLIVPVLASNT